MKDMIGVIEMECKEMIEMEGREIKEERRVRMGTMMTIIKFIR